MGALEETSIDENKGAVRVIQVVIPTMRKEGGGIIVNITSLGARVSFPLNSPYHATKFAPESIQYELEYSIQSDSSCDSLDSSTRNFKSNV